MHGGGRRWRGVTATPRRPSSPLSVMRSTPSAAIPAIAATATVKSALAAAAAASSFGTSSSEMSSSVSFGKGATMRSERVKGADEGESDPGWDSGRLASHAGGVSAASNIITLGGTFVAHPPPRRTPTAGTKRVMKGAPCV